MTLVTLMTGTLGLNLDDSWFRTSARSCWCFNTFLIFMILTIAAYTHNNTHKNHRIALSLQYCTRIKKSPLTKTVLHDHAKNCNHLYEEFSILLNVFVSRFLFLLLLSLHGDIDVHSQLLTATKTELSVSKNKLSFLSPEPKTIIYKSLTSYIPGTA